MTIIPQVITEDRASGAQVIDGSLKFDKYLNQHLKRTPSSAGNRKTWTISFWAKRTIIDTQFHTFMSVGTVDGNEDTVSFDGNQLRIRFDSGSDLETEQRLRDTGWYHIVIAVDTTLSTSSDRIKYYINGTRVTNFSPNAQPGLNFDFRINNNQEHAIGKFLRYSPGDYAGHMSQYYFIDGQALDASYFGFTDPLTDTWRPKKFVPTGPNNGTTWSSNVTGNIYGGSAANVFDGEPSADRAEINSSDANDNHFTLSSMSVRASKVGVYVSNSGSDVEVSINGSVVGTISSGDITSSSKLFSFTFTETTVNSIKVRRVGSTSGWYLYGINLNDVHLLDGDTSNIGLNGFYLPMDGNSPIGEDKSGRGNNWTPVNFGGSNSIEKATGALPILNTVNGGTTAAATVREDANASNLILAVPLDGNTQDHSGKINNSRTPLTFSVNGNAAPTTAQSNFYGGSYTFDGATDSVYATVPNSDALFLQNSNFTVECWVRIASGQTDDRYFIMLGSGTASNSDGSWYFRIFQSKFEFIIVNGNTQYKTISAENYTANKWTHIAFVREGNEQRLYIDGILSATTSHTVLPNLNNSSSLFIGSSYAYNNTINAQIQDARIYDNVAKYTSNFIPAATKPDILPDTPSGVAYGSELKQIAEGSVNGGVSNGDTLLVGNSSDFNFGSGDFTVELFAYHTSTAGNDTLVGMWNSGANRRTWMIDIEADQGRLRGYWSTDGSAFSNVQTATNYIARRRWNHIVFCRQGNTMRLYLNGNQEATATESGSLYNNTDDSLGILSATDVGNDPCKGHISNVRILKGTCLYPDGTSFTPPSAPLTNVTNTKLLCCQSKTSANAVSVGPGTFVNDGTNYSSNNQVTGSTGLVNADSIFNGHLKVSGVPTLNEGATVSLSSDNYILWTPTTGIPYSSKVEVFCYAPNGYSITTYYTFNGGTETSFVGGGANYNGNTWITVATGSGTINSIKLRLTRTSPNQSQMVWYAVRVDGTILINDFNGKSIAKQGSVSQSTFNPFNDNINTVRGQETGWATLNTLDRSNPALDDSRVKLSNGNLSWQGTLTGCAVRGSIPMTSGKWYWEVTSTNSNRFFAGVMKTDVRPYDQDGGLDSNSWVFQTDGNLYHNGSSSAYGFATNATGDLTMVAYDADNGNLYFGGNGIWFNGSDPATGTSPAYSSVTNEGGISPVVSRRTGVCNCDINFGQNTFRFAPPEGFKTLCLANLPKPTSPAASNADKYFNTVLYTGNSSSKSITDVGFQSDFVWIKQRNAAENHFLTDSVRGAGIHLRTDSTVSENDDSATFTAFTSNGFNLTGTGPAAPQVNDNTDTYVAWCWKAGGNSGTFNIDGRGYATAAEAGLNGGTITPTGASVNTESGFSIITYTGDGSTSSGVTINHGLGDTPAFIITKKRSSGTTDYGWSCWHKNLGGNYGIWLHLGNTRNASMWDGHTNISSTVFSPPDLNYGNENGQTYVNYLWSEVPGYSKIGSYIGNGSYEGSFVECGFRPAWVMIKVAGGSTGNSWTVWDNKRDTKNEMDLYLHPNETQEDGTYSAIKMDFLSNGFKPRGDIIHQNTNGTLYIFVAFAEAPINNLYGGQANAR